MGGDREPRMYRAKGVSYGVREQCSCRSARDAPSRTSTALGSFARTAATSARASPKVQQRGLGPSDIATPQLRFFDEYPGSTARTPRRSETSLRAANLTRLVEVMHMRVLLTLSSVKCVRGLGMSASEDLTPAASTSAVGRERTDRLPRIWGRTVKSLDCFFPRDISIPPNNRWRGP
jgi:hypothetical protein